jgi:hypothetical protein
MLVTILTNWRFPIMEEERHDYTRERVLIFYYTGVEDATFCCGTREKERFLRLGRDV